MIWLFNQMQTHMWLSFFRNCYRRSRTRSFYKSPSLENGLFTLRNENTEEKIRQYHKSSAGTSLLWLLFCARNYSQNKTCKCLFVSSTSGLFLMQHVIKQFGNMNRIHHLLLFDTSFSYMYTALPLPFPQPKKNTSHSADEEGRSMTQPAEKYIINETKSGNHKTRCGYFSCFQAREISNK